MDLIELRGMSFHGRHGVRPAEREQPQEFKVDIAVEADLAQASRTDRLADTIDYTKLRGIARTVIEGPPASLLETLAGRIADLALEVPGVASVSVRVAKFPASMQPIDSAAVRISRTRA
jgi:7,8-dihydroneopterin aldolase/epimerase/oxygenase